VGCYDGEVRVEGGWDRSKAHKNKMVIC